MRNSSITKVTRALSEERNSSVFIVEFRLDGPLRVDCQTHATLRDDQLPRHVILETLISALEDSTKHYRKQLADLLGDRVNEQEQAAAAVQGMLNEEKPEGATYCRPLGNGYLILVFPRFFGAGSLCLAKQGNDWSDCMYDYPRLVDAVNAAVEWSGEGDPKDGWVRHWPSGRRRPDGTPASEKVEP